MARMYTTSSGTGDLDLVAVAGEAPYSGNNAVEYSIHTPLGAYETGTASVVSARLVGRTVVTSSDANALISVPQPPTAVSIYLTPQVVPPEASGDGLADGNYGDITVGGDGTTMAINNGAVDLTATVTGILPLANGGTGALLADPGADRIAFWDDSAGAVTWLTVGTNLTLTDTTLTATGGGGEGDVTKVGTPANNQVGVWTGDSTIEGDSALTFDTSTDTLAIAASGNLAFGAVNVLDDAAGTMTLSNIDALDATTEATIESAIDTLANLVSVQGRAIALADAGADAVFGWDDSGSTYANLSASDARAALGITTDGAAVAADINTGTSTTLAVTPDAIAGSNLGIRLVELLAGSDYTSDAATGDGQAYFVIPAAFNGMNLVYVHGKAITAGTTGTALVQVRNVTQTADMLTTRITYESGQTNAGTSTAAVIDASNDDVATADLIAIDVDQLSTTKQKGLIITLGFQLP